MNKQYDLIEARRGIDMEFLRGLWNGETGPWFTVAGCAVIVVGMAIAQKFFGFKIPDKKARRQAMERRKTVLWKYERDE